MSGPGGQIDHIVASGRVDFQQGERKATGDKLVYTADDEHFVLTGTADAPPRVTDPVHGTVSGSSLIFNNRDDSVVVSRGTIGHGHGHAHDQVGDPSGGMQKLIVDEIGKAYKGRQVVRGVSLEISQGEVVGLLGPNGAGKTTSFYMIVGLIAPDSGACADRRQRYIARADVHARSPVWHKLPAAGTERLP